MSRIDELIGELAPDGVRHIALSEIADYSNTRVDASELDATSFVGVDNLVANNGGRVDASYLPNTARLTGYEPGDILLGNIRPYLKKAWLATDAGGCSGDVLAVRIREDAEHALSPQFLFYLLSSDEFFAYNMQHAKGAKMPRGNKVAILNYRVPVPPLEVQQEIVRVLDQLTHLKVEVEVELELELEARRLQYEHYRSALLSFGSDTEQSRLGEIAEYVNGKAHERLVSADGDIPLVTARFISRNGEANRFVSREDVRTPACVGDTALVLSDLPNGRALARTFFIDQDAGYAINQRIARLRVKDASQVEPKFLFHVLDRNPGLLIHDNGADQTHLSKAQVTGLLFPVPSLEEQRRIVGVLDKFNALMNDLSVDLLAELAARRKQYEYYRDKLLTFEEAVA